MKTLSSILALTMVVSVFPANEKTDDKKYDLKGKVIWPDSYTLEIARPQTKITEGKTYLGNVLQNLINDELSLQSHAITRGKVFPVIIEYAVQKDHDTIAADERSELLRKFEMPKVLALKILRSKVAPEEKFNCGSKPRQDQYNLFSRISGSVGALKIDVMLCQGSEIIYRQSALTDEQELVSSVTRLMNPVRGKLTGDVYASMKIETTPVRSSVYIDDQFIGKTPLKYSYLIPGKYRLSIKKDGFESKNEQIIVAANDTLTRTVELAIAPGGGVLDITTTPAGARIYLDADYKGVTPKKVENIRLGTYRLHLLHPEKGESYKSVTLTEDNPALLINESLSGYVADKVPGFLGLSYKTWYWVTLGIAASSMGTGIGFYVWRDQANEDIFARLSGKSPDQYTSDDTAFVAEKRSQYDARNGYATGFMVGAGVFAAISIYFYVRHLLAAEESIVMQRPPKKDEGIEIRIGGVPGTAGIPGTTGISATFKF